ncbi:F-box/LRR-repeat protein At4g29420 isoform X2 [Physcomitrium patens]|nr:uncharacterized protein LOC112295865 isoform X2 [Physcomitrium patens]|eukprot:XP_024403653.1 uncharacterized protein LOC112295865 isoform X2 [Physcomitrella patens]
MEMLQLPVPIVEDILDRVGDAKDILNVQLVCKYFWGIGENIRSVRIVVLNRFHERARRSTGSLALEEKPSIAGSPESLTDAPKSASTIKHKIVKFLENKLRLEQLHIEIEPMLQAKSVPEDERRRDDFWMSDPGFLNQCVARAGSRLQHLCVVDYGQQAIMRKSSILRIVSQSCELLVKPSLFEVQLGEPSNIFCGWVCTLWCSPGKHLRVMDLRNAFIDTTDCEIMASMTSLTLRCVKVNGSALQDINATMPKLQTLALLSVFGAEGGDLSFEHMSVLCLGLSTPAKKVNMYLPNLTKLQLKMQCPKDLCIRAPVLKYVAFNLDVAQGSKVELFCVNEALETTITSTVPTMKGKSCSNVEVQLENSLGLLELLYGASSFITFSNLVLSNPNLRKIFLDVPCMALADDGRFLEVLKNVQLNLPRFSCLHSCRDLKVLNIGPGLWYCMETSVETLLLEEAWPSMQKLILHMIPHNLEASAKVLGLLLRTSVTSVVIYIHTSSPVTSKELQPKIQEQVANCEQDIKLEILAWTKSLDFSCFSF